MLIATPGRLLDFYDRRKLMLLDVKTLVVDEADRMLDMGFIPDLERIFEITPKQKQTLFFSATMPPEITRADLAVPEGSDADRGLAARPPRARTSSSSWCACPSPTPRPSAWRCAR